ncbi:MAG: helix-turn-helix domain-containing protein [Prevotellaceae bacterium]|jgi:transcriptional regulator with XRE-family HTH domain|nr:helix-turn-helix domain-containing protein [Prevotellaceae bacterium]
MKNINIHIGNIISDIMKNQNVTMAELARRLEVKPQSVDYLLKRKSIDTHTLYNISIALEYDFAKFFSIEKKQTNCDKANYDFSPKVAKVLLEVELNTEDIIKLNLKDRVIKILNE